MVAVVSKGHEAGRAGRAACHQPADLCRGLGRPCPHRDAGRPDAELSVAHSRIETLDALLPEDVFHREALPWSAAFLAGKAFLAYRRRGGARASPLPDFYIGAHAAVRGYRLLTRDQGRYTTYFPTLTVISPV